MIGFHSIYLTLNGFSFEIFPAAQFFRAFL